MIGGRRKTAQIIVLLILFIWGYMAYSYSPFSETRTSIPSQETLLTHGSKTKTIMETLSKNIADKHNKSTKFRDLAQTSPLPLSKTAPAKTWRINQPQIQTVSNISRDLQTERLMNTSTKAHTPSTTHRNNTSTKAHTPSTTHRNKLIAEKLAEGKAKLAAQQVTTTTTEMPYSDLVTLMQQRQALRKSRIDKVCSQHPELHKNLSAMTKKELYDFGQYMFADDNNKVIFCFIPKAASHTVRAIVLNNTGKLEISPKVRLSPWRGGKLAHIGVSRIVGANISAQDVQRKLDTYFTFLFPRHPLDRLVSAFHDKFLGIEKSFAQTMAQQVKTMFRENPTNDSQWQSDRITFKEFLKFILHPDQKPDWHWMSVQQLCQPCTVNYDFIGSTETFSSDARYLIRHELSSRGYFFLPRMHTKRKDVGIDTNSSAYVRRLEEFTQLGEEDTEYFAGAVHRFQTDMDMFGYSYSRAGGEGPVNAMCVTPTC